MTALERLKAAEAAEDAHPGDWRAHLLLANALAEQKGRGQALRREREFVAAAKLGAAHPSAQFALAAYYLETNRGADAVEPASAAAKLAPGDPSILDTLGAALAAAGRCDLAIFVSERALASANHGQSEKELAELESHLAARRKCAAPSR